MRARSALLALCLAACSNTGSRQDREQSIKQSPPEQLSGFLRQQGVSGHEVFWVFSCDMLVAKECLILLSVLFCLTKVYQKLFSPGKPPSFIHPFKPYCWIFCCMNCIETTDTEGDQVIDVVIQSCSCNASTKFDFFGFRWINLEHLPQRWNCNN